MLSRLCNGDIASNVPHTERACDSAVHEERPTAQFVDQDEKPEQSDHCFDDAKDSSGKKRGVSASDPNTLENSG